MLPSHLLLLLLLCALCTVQSIFVGEVPFGKYKWRDLTQEELNGWYTPTDLCVLETTKTTAFPTNLRAEDCYNHSRGNRRTFCSVGMGNNNNPCYGPYGSARPSFKKGVEGFTNYSSTPLLDAFGTFIKQDTTLILLGDSTTRQKLQWMECEIRREEPRIRTSGNIWGILPCNTRYTVTFPDGRIMVVLIISVGPNSANCLKGGLGKHAPASGIFENAAHLVEQELVQQKKSVFVVANMGLWYNDEDTFARFLPPLLQWLQTVAEIPARLAELQERQRQATRPLSAEDRQYIGKYKYAKHTQVVWHETLSQHWAHPWGTGYFAKPYVDAQEEAWDMKTIANSNVAEFEVPNCCRAISNTSYMADWRNDLVKDLLFPNNPLRRDYLAHLGRSVPLSELGILGPGMNASSLLSDTSNIISAGSGDGSSNDNGGSVSSEVKSPSSGTVTSSHKNTTTTTSSSIQPSDGDGGGETDVTTTIITEITTVTTTTTTTTTTTMANNQHNAAASPHTFIKNPSAKYPNIGYFPLVEITRPLADIHTCNPMSKHDCTHYCFTPLTFQPFWHQIADAAARTAH